MRLRFLAAVLLLAEVPSIPLGTEISAPAPAVTRARYLMGTVFRFEAPGGSSPRATGEALESALDEVDRLEQILSNWKEGSELSRLNRSASRRAVPVSSELFGAVRQSLSWARETGGAFDPTVEPLTRRFRSASGSPETLMATPGRRVDSPRGTWRGVQAEPGARTIRFGPGVEGLDLCGIGKGYALDRAAALLRRKGLNAFLLDAGGKLLAVGRPPGEEGWLVAVADPSHRERPCLPLRLRDASAATSGNSERPGQLLDPATGTPVASAGSSTVVTADATSADALATALFVLGAERGTQWARQREDVFAVFLDPGPEPGAAPTLRGTLPEGWEKGRTITIDSRIRAGRSVLNVSLR